LASVGLLTLDVTALGVVMTSDVQPVELLDGGLRVLPLSNETKVKKIMDRHGGGFHGLVGYVGTERIGNATVRSVLENTIQKTSDLPLQQFCTRLAEDLSAAWREHSLSTCLWVFVAGVEESEPRFWFVVNGELAPAGFYVNISDHFKVVNDLDMYAVPRAAAELGVATKDEVLARTTFFFRNGAIVPSAQVLDAFEPVVRTLYLGRFPGFPPIDTIDAYAAIVRVRQEFVKRLFDKPKGVWRGEGPGHVGGDIHVYSVDLTGAVRSHHKHA
jgi:hypothetical protein